MLKGVKSGFKFSVVYVNHLGDNCYIKKIKTTKSQLVKWLLSMNKVVLLLS